MAVKTAVKATAGLAAAASATLLYQAYRAINRPDLPSFVDMNASGVFGDEHSPPLKMVTLGDSSMTGPGLSSPRQIWVAVVAQRLAETFRVTLSSKAVGGSQVADLFQDQLPLALDENPDLAIVAVGSNDMLRGVGIKQFETTLDEIVGALSERCDTIALSGVGDLGTIPRLERPLADLASALGRRGDRAHQRVARRHGVIKLPNWEKASPLFKDPGMFADDHFHASAAGHQLWGDIAYETILPHVRHLATR